MLRQSAASDAKRSRHAQECVLDNGLISGVANEYLSAYVIKDHARLVSLFQREWPDVMRVDSHRSFGAVVCRATTTGGRSA